MVIVGLLGMSCKKQPPGGLIVHSRRESETASMPSASTLFNRKNCGLPKGEKLKAEILKSEICVHPCSSVVELCDFPNRSSPIRWARELFCGTFTRGFTPGCHLTGFQPDRRDAILTCPFLRVSRAKGQALQTSSLLHNGLHVHLPCRE